MDSCISYLAETGGRLADRAPIVLAGVSAAAGDLAHAFDAAGWRTVTSTLADLPARLEMQATAAALVVDLRHQDDEPWEAPLEEALSGRPFPLVLSGPAAMIDRLAAFADRHEAEILVDPTAFDAVSTLAQLTSWRGASAAVHDVASEPSAARLRQLSDEVGRIAATLARLSSGPAAATELPRPIAGGGATPDVSGEQVRTVIRARRARAKYFDAELFADPAWDMLLDLLQAEIAQHRVPVSSLCIAASVPPTTALRWIKTMTDAGLFNRRADPHDGRRIFVELAPTASRAMRQYFAEVGATAAA